MRHLVIGQRQKAPNFSAFHWSPHGCLIIIGQHFVTIRTRLCGPCIAAKAVFLFFYGCLFYSMCVWGGGRWCKLFKAKSAPQEKILSCTNRPPQCVSIEQRKSYKICVILQKMTVKYGDVSTHVTSKF